MIERSGLKVILIELIALFILLLLPVFFPLALFTLLLISFTVFFFRDPPRVIREGVVSPADGKIDFVEGQRLEIFMSPFDCHINRAPVSGKIEKVVYKKGKFIPAFRREDSAEKNEIFIRNEKGTFKVTQIAGFFARRISCYVKEGDWVEKGEKIGMIKFGSRVCLDLPPHFRITRKIGEKVKAGDTVAVEVQ
ncbi:MAG: phosphatidylserine decarboxylase [Archaeoglobus sp.]|nr:phosphatidylserine decarboxylase [Archaeoglobus sp.]